MQPFSFQPWRRPGLQEPGSIYSACQLWNRFFFHSITGGCGRIYRLLGLEHYSEEQLCEEFQGFTDPYLEADNYYPMSIGEVSVSDVTVLTDLEGEVFEEQVLDYMRYGIVASVMDKVTVDSYISGMRDGTSLSDLRDYREHAKAAVRLEEET